MKKINYFIFAAAIILIYSCSEKKEFLTTFKGSIDGGDWINPNTIGKFYGYSGDYCSKIDTVNQYSYGFRKIISEFSQNPIKKIKVSVWVKLEDLSKKTPLVISVTGKDNKNIYWAGHDVNPSIKEANKWFKFEVNDSLPDFDPNGARIETYVWNPNKNVAYIDDFEISFSGE